MVVTATGHDGPMGASSAKRLESLGALPAGLPGMGALDMNTAEVRAQVPMCECCARPIAVGHPAFSFARTPWYR